ncbi:TonB-dependent receptor [Acidipila sp. EB88]|nr:TonB-dependent receptor [Acidipila sp. EB88]
MLAATGVLCASGSAVLAQEISAAQPAEQQGASQVSGPAATQTDPQDATKVTAREDVTVTAPGSTRDVQSIGAKEMLQSTPGTSPIAVLGRLPSVEITSADPYGAYEWAVRISVRGFNQNQLGFTLDDVPLGDMSYGNLNGLHISRALIDENLGQATLSQGTGALETASTSNLGGAIQFMSNDPLDKRKLEVAQSFGSFSATRTFGRFDSGVLPGHTRFYIDGVYQLSDKWRGAGPINQSYYQGNLKLEHFVGNKGVLTFFVDYSHRQEVDYQDDNKVWVNKLGYKWDNFGNWGVALQAANAYNAQGGGGFVFASLPTTFPTPVSSLQSAPGDLSNDPEDAGYYAAGGLRRDILSYLSYKMALTSHLTWKSTVYGHENSGAGLWFTPYEATYDATGTPVSPISERTSEYGIARGGFVTSLSYETARNTVEGGAWFEKESFDLARKFYATSLASPVQSIYDRPSNAFYTQWSYNFPSTVYQLHLQDQYRIRPTLTVSAGFKSVETNMTGNLGAFNTGVIQASGVTAATYAQGSLESGKAFLPQFGVNWKINKNNEMFADVADNVRAYQAGGPGFGNSPWGTSQAGFNALTSTLKPESSWSEEAGVRHTDNRFQGQASYFHVNFSNRLLAIQQGPAIAGAASLLTNVGGVTTNGVDGAVSAKLHEGWTLYNALTFSRSTYNDDYTTTGATGVPATVATGGKIVVDSPEFLYKNELSYAKGQFDAHIDSDYMGKRYFTYTDDNSVSGRFLANFGLDYHKDEVGAFDQLKLQLNVYNLAGAQYYSTVGTNGFIASDPTSVSLNTLQVGAPRTITGTFSVRF